MNTLNEIINKKVTTFLIDAAGVLYNDIGPIPGVSQAIHHLQDVGQVFVVTNNTTLYIDQISQKLAGNDITIDQKHIISSGLGLNNPEINQYLQQKNVYVFGREKSFPYVINAGCKALVSLDQAQCIVMTDTYQEQTDLHFTNLINFCTQNPHIPVICCNPDKRIMTDSGKYRYVIGHYAQLLADQVPLKVHWIGKPFANFTSTVQQILTSKHNIKLNQQVCFFDDNLENIKALAPPLNINGCLIKETGLSKHLDFSKLTNQLNYQPAFLLPKLTLPSATS
jgi:HAD superfamily hydrolase (TIGR01450 family)